MHPSNLDELHVTVDRSLYTRSKDYLPHLRNLRSLCMHAYILYNTYGGHGSRSKRLPDLDTRSDRTRIQISNRGGKKIKWKKIQGVHFHGHLTRRGGTIDENNSVWHTSCFLNSVTVKNKHPHSITHGRSQLG